jgi:hypothetical protein
MIDDETRVLWREADAAIAREVEAEKARRPAREMMAAAIVRLRAWRALERRRRLVHRKHQGAGRVS